MARVTHYHTTKEGIKHYLFFCPGCKEHHEPNSRIWQFNEDFDRPTFSPSILVSKPRSGPYCHSFVRDGRIEFLPDCKHELAGQTVDLPELYACFGLCYFRSGRSITLYFC